MTKVWVLWGVMVLCCGILGYGTWTLGTRAERCQENCNTEINRLRSEIDSLSTEIYFLKREASKTYQHNSESWFDDDDLR